MYKIILYDHNCSPICDGTVSFFVDELEDFEKYWLNNEYVDEETKKRFLRSKNGEIVTDYYTDDPKYNIVQVDENAKILSKKSYTYEDKHFTLYNTYGCESEIYAKRTDIKLRYIQFKDDFFLVGQYKLVGVCKEDFARVKDDMENGWRECSVWGNPIHKTKHTRVGLWIDDDGMRRLDYPKEKFKDDEIETYCWVTVGEYNKENGLIQNDLNELHDELFEILMRDIPGEAG